ncbi:MAG: AI-2E family transporter, partial [Tepidisphaeraceae bacterium]
MPRPVAGRAPRLQILASVCVVVAALYLARDVLIPLALAILLTFLLTPLVMRLQRYGVKRVMAVLVVLTMLVAAVLGLGWLVTVQVMDLANNLEQYKGNIIAKIETFKLSGGVIDRFQQGVKDVQKELDKPATTQATQPVADDAAAQILTKEITGRTGEPRTITEESVGKAPNPAQQPTKENPLPVAVITPSHSPLQQLARYLGLVLGPLGTAGLVIIFVIFMLLEREDLRDRIVRLVGYGQLNLTTQAMDDAATRISRYLLAQAIVNGSYGVAISIGLWLIGHVAGDQPFPNVVLWGLLCAVLRFIPYIGPWIAAAFPILVSFAVYKGFGVFIATGVLFVVIELLSNNIMEPLLYGSSTGMTAVAVLVSAVFWTWLWGPIGLVMATPLTVCLVVLGKYVPPLQFLDILLGDEPVLDPPSRIYQRLLALDQEEALDVAEEYRRDMTLAQVYDNVLIPALAMAEQDRHKGKLDEQRKDFIRSAMRDIVEELGEREQRLRISVAAAETVAKARDEDRATADASGT